jgi:hypothetical protein
VFGINTGGLARQTRYLLLLAQKQVTEEKGTLRHGPTGCPVLLGVAQGLGDVSSFMGDG